MNATASAPPEIPAHIQRIVHGVVQPILHLLVPRVFDDCLDHAVLLVFFHHLALELVLNISIRIIEAIRHKLGRVLLARVLRRRLHTAPLLFVLRLPA